MGWERVLRRFAAVLVAVAVLVGPSSAGASDHDGHDQAHEVDGVDEGFDLDGASGTVYRLYRAYFLRDPDADGFSYWVSVHERGHSLAAISEEFARSAEFSRTYGALTDLAFVERVYRNVLGRVPDQGGYDYWIGQMALGLRRGEVMLAFSDSVEFRAKTASGARPATSTPDDPSAYVLLWRLPSGEPVRWNPCRPVRVAANLTGAPAGTEAVLRTAVGRLASATSVGWTYVGTTSARANDHVASDPASARTPDAEVVVSWPAVWESAAAGMGGASWRQSPTGETWFVHGSVQIDPGLRITADQMLHLLMHELGHVAGLGHPSASGQVMSTGGRLELTDFRAGDRAGLALVGRGSTVC